MMVIISEFDESYHASKSGYYCECGADFNPHHAIELELSKAERLGYDQCDGCWPSGSESGRSATTNRSDDASPDTIDAATVLDVFDERPDLARPITVSDVVDELGVARRTARNKLNALVERGYLDTREIGAHGRVWWRPIKPQNQIDSEAVLGTDDL